MGYTNQSQFGSNHEGKGRAPLAFRFRKTKQKEVKKASPFTEMPEELKNSSLTPGGVLRRIFNTLLMVILSAALLALVAAFAYAMMNDPESLAEASYSLVNQMQTFIRSLFGTG